MEITLEAGTAFGSGAHPSTQLVLHAMELLAAQRSFTNALDLGCGSGVLAIAAAKFFGASVLATDLQPEALAQTAKNAALNHVEDRIRTRRADGPRSQEIALRAPYDLILCNVLADVMLPWLRELKSLLSAEGILCFSGILSWQAGGFRQNLEAAGLRVRHVINDAQWCAILAEASASA